MMNLYQQGAVTGVKLAVALAEEEPIRPIPALYGSQRTCQF